MGLPSSVMQIVHKDNTRKGLPDIRPGMTVRVHQKIKEGEKERVQIFEGLVIKTSSGTGIEKTFTVRKIVDGIGVERIFPFHSTNIKKIDIVKVAKVRQARLYYMRDRSGKSARLREDYIDVKGKDLEAEMKEEEKSEEEAEEIKGEIEAQTNEMKEDNAAEVVEGKESVEAEEKTE